MQLAKSLLPATAAAFLLLGLAAETAEAQRGGPNCVVVGGQRVCRLGAGSRAPNAALPRYTRTGKTTYSQGCRPGTKPDGKWYLVSCGKGQLCRSRCYAVNR